MEGDRIRTNTVTGGRHGGDTIRTNRRQAWRVIGLGLIL